MSEHYAIYKIDTGEIVSEIQVPDLNHAMLQLSDGQALLKGKFSAMLGRVVNGRFKPYTEDEVDRRAQIPKFLAKWDVNHRRWIDLRSGQDKIDDHNRTIMREIQDFESRQARAIRDAILTQDTTRLREIDDSIAQLRTQLKD